VVFEYDLNHLTGAKTARHFVGSALVLQASRDLPTLGPSDLRPPEWSAPVLNKVEHWMLDHLGSVAATLDHRGEVTARYAYDPFGKRRFVGGNYDSAGTLEVPWANDLSAGTGRGFTGHEEIDDLGLINMNGRIYDDTVALFAQADPFVTDPLNLQHYNRYGYGANNPLNGTDPDGYNYDSGAGQVIVIPITAPRLPAWQPWQPQPSIGSPTWSDAWLWDINRPYVPGTWRPSGPSRPVDPRASLPSTIPKLGSNNKYGASQSKAQALVDAAKGAGTRFAEGFLGLQPLGPDASVAEQLGRGSRVAIDWGLVAVDVINSFVSPTPDVGLIGASGIAARTVAKEAAEDAATVSVWGRTATQRGIDIEDALAATDYAGWFRVGQLNNGKFPLVDFQQGNNLVSLKSVDTTGSTWMGRMREHISKLSTNGATVNGNPANMILDLRVQPGGSAAAADLVQFGRQNGVTVIVKEFP
jgi:RHS repeat-associated protein